MKQHSLMGKLVRSEGFMMGVVAPIVAVVMAFVVSGLIILAFISTYSLNEETYARMRKGGVPEPVIQKLDRITEKDYTQKDAFIAAVAKAIGKRPLPTTAG